MPFDALESFLLNPPVEVVPTPKHEPEVVTKLVDGWDTYKPEVVTKLVDGWDTYKPEEGLLEMAYEYQKKLMKKLEGKWLAPVTGDTVYVVVDYAKNSEVCNKDPELPPPTMLELEQTMLLIVQARQLITPEYKWTKGCLFRNYRGETVGLVEQAESFCSMGALYKMANGMPRGISTWQGQSLSASET